MRAERDLALAAARLGFFRRSADGTMQPPAPSELPADMGALPALAGDSLTSAAQIDDVLARHPQLGALRNAVSRSKLAIALRENALKPRLDVNLEVGHGLGAIAEGGSSRDSTDPIIALSFAVPIERRTARARLEQERNKLSALEFETREAADRMEQALLELGLRRTFARSLFGLATQEVEQLRALQEAERRRFAAGASDFFLVNVREENTANSEIQLLNAQLDAVVCRCRLCRRYPGTLRRSISLTSQRRRAGGDGSDQPNTMALARTTKPAAMPTKMASSGFASRRISSTTTNAAAKAAMA